MELRFLLLSWCLLLLELDLVFELPRREEVPLLCFSGAVMVPNVGATALLERSSLCDLEDDEEDDLCPCLLLLLLLAFVELLASGL